MSKPQLLTPQALVEQLLALPNLATQKRYLQQHGALLNDQVANELKEEARRLLYRDSQRSLQTTESLIYLAELTGNPLHFALGLRAKAHALSMGGAGEYQRALDLYDEAAAIYEAHGCTLDQARMQIGRIHSLASLGRYDDALEVGRWASQVLEEHEDWLLLAKLTVNLGIIHHRMGADLSALKLFDQARDLYIRLGGASAELHNALARVEQNRSVCLRNLGRFGASIEASRSAMSVLTDSAQQAGAARAQQNLAMTYFLLGHYNEALELLDETKDFFLANGRQRDAILAELFITDCLLQLRRFGDVLEKCRQFQAQFDSRGMSLEVAHTIMNKAVAYAGLNRHAEALSALAEARSLFEEEEHSVLAARTDLEMATVLYHQKRFEDSWQAAQTAAQTFRSHELPVEEAQANLLAARSLVNLHRQEEAQRLVTLAAAAGKDVPALVYQSHYLLGTLARHQEDAQKALTEYDRAIQELEQLRGQLMVEFRADFLEDKQGVYEEIVDLHLDLEQPAQGLNYVERAKSRALLDLLDYRLDLSIRAKGPEDAPVVRELMALRSERDQLYRRWAGSKEFGVDSSPPAQESQQQVQQQVVVLEKRITGLWHKLLIRNADYARQAALWQVRTEPVQPYLEPDTLLLEYFVVKGKLVAFLVTADRVSAQRLDADLGQVQHLLRFLWLNLKAVSGGVSGRARPLAANAQGLLQQLHGLLIAPLADKLAPYQRLIVAPCGPLHYLPFHTLHDGRSFLLEQHTISYLPAASLLRYCREMQPTTSEVLIIGNSHGGLLPHAVEEARSVAAILKGEVTLEMEATSTWLRKAAPSCRVLHLAAHGEFRPDHPLFSGLALADGWLTTLDIFNLRLNASLVTLSACQTGRSVVGGGNELLGLMRAFLSAGAASLLLSLWAVEDRSTAYLMEIYYRKLAEGQSKGAALRQAQLEFVRGAGPGGDGAAEWRAHPYFWGSFFLVGDDGPL